MTTESDDPKTLVGGLLGQGLPDTGPLSARSVLRDTQNSLFGDKDSSDSKTNDAPGRSGSRRTGGTDAENRIATRKARRQRRVQASSLTQGFGQTLGL